jgi:hypothetical protein
VAGAAIFLAVASISWIEPKLAKVPGASGGAGIVWGLSALPVFAVCTLLNLGALAWACMARRRQGAWPVSSLAWVSVFVWLAALALDNSRHGISPALQLPTPPHHQTDARSLLPLVLPSLRRRQ